MDIRGIYLPFMAVSQLLTDITGPQIALVNVLVQLRELLMVSRMFRQHVVY